MIAYPLISHQIFYDGTVYLRQTVPHVSDHVFWYTVGDKAFYLITDMKLNTELDDAFGTLKEQS